MWPKPELDVFAYFIVQPLSELGGGRSTDINHAVVSSFCRVTRAVPVSVVLRIMAKDAPLQRSGTTTKALATVEWVGSMRIEQKGHDWHDG